MESIMWNVRDCNRKHIEKMMKKQFNQTNKRTNQVRQENFNLYVESIGGKNKMIEPTFRTRDVYSPTDRLNGTFGRMKTEEEIMDTELDMIIRELENEL